MPLFLAGAGRYMWARMPESCAGDALNTCLDAACAAAVTTPGWFAMRKSNDLVASIVCALPATDDTKVPGTPGSAPNGWITGAAQLTSTPFCDAYVAKGAVYQAPTDGASGDRIPALVLCTNGTDPFDFVAGPRNPPCSMGSVLDIPNTPNTFIGTACRDALGTPGQLGTISGTCVTGLGSETETFEEFCPPAESFLS